MALDGPDDSDAAGDADPGRDPWDSEPSARGEARAAPAELHGREECHDELRGRDRAGPGRPGPPRPDEPQRTADGGWRWKGLELDPEADRIADRQITACRKAEGRDAEGNYGEGGITPAMRRIEAGLEHGTLVPDTEQFALKSPDRFKEKLAKMISLEPDVAPRDLAGRIHDGIRFTLLFESRFYSSGVTEAEFRLTGEGHALVGRKPSWSGGEYKGINSQWRDSDSGQLFEVQFHTPESWDAKQRTHDAYEKIESPATPPEERARLRAYQREIAASVPVPPAALEFVPYKTEDDGECRRR